MLRFVKVALSFAISIGLIIWLFSGVDMAAVYHHAKEIHFWPLPILILIFYTHYFFRALRWQFLLPGKVPLMPLVDGIFIGNLGTFLLPLRAGEIIRPGILSMKRLVTFPTAFVSVIAERLFDLSFVLLTFFILRPTFAKAAPWVANGALILASIGITLFFGLVAVIFLPGKFGRVVSLVVGVSKAISLPQLGNIVEKIFHDVLEGTKVLRHPRNLLLVTFLTAVVWGLNYLFLQVSLFLFTSPLLTPHPALFGTACAVIIALAVAAPSAPGFLGVYQSACLASFTLFSLPKAESLAFGMI
jgi:uncharacterized protein (TIRG00374 family)